MQSGPLVLGKASSCLVGDLTKGSRVFCTFDFLSWHGSIGWKMIFHLIWFDVFFVIMICLVGNGRGKRSVHGDS